jgi:ribosomal-protein-alanine N-acetyltransferase
LLERSFTLRTAHISDASEIASMSRQQVEYGLHWRWTRDRVKRHIRDVETTVVVASQAGVLQGFAIMKFRDVSAHLLLLAVQPKIRRRGIGSAMLDWLESSCATAGIRQVRLEVRADNGPARKFYEHMGYRQVGHLAAYYDQREAAVVMGRTINEKIAS